MVEWPRGVETFMLYVFSRPFFFWFFVVVSITLFDDFTSVIVNVKVCN